MKNVLTNECKPQVKYYEEYLNDLGSSLSEDSFWFMKGKYNPNKYGTYLKKYDPIAFRVGMKEYFAY